MIGPGIVTTSSGYGCTERLIGGPFNPRDPDTFVVGTKDVEYLDVEDNEAHDEIRQAVHLPLRSGLNILN